MIMLKATFDSDGIPDIVWQKPGTNETKFWFMNTDGTKKSELDLSHTAGVVWRFASMADMNNDGKEDMLWQKEDGSTVLLLLHGWFRRSFIRGQSCLWSGFRVEVCFRIGL